MSVRRTIIDFVRDPRLALVGAVVIVSIAGAISGCISGPQNPATTQPVTITDTATTQPGYWYAKPSPATIVYDSFPTLIKTCENVCRDFGFQIDRVDYRTGLLTTVPLDSAQVFEPWRPDVRTEEDAKQSTIATVRRTIRFVIVRNFDGTFQCSPQVLIERQTVQEQRITNVALYRGSFSQQTSKDVPAGTHETDEGFQIPAKFWYSIGRDHALEEKLAHVVSKRLAEKGREMNPAPTTEPTTTPSPSLP